MNSRQKKTLHEIFERPTRSDLKWADIVGVLKALGAEFTEGSGSRVGVALKGKRAVFHRPHNPPVAKKGLVEAVRGFLASVEVKS